MTKWPYCDCKYRRKPFGNFPSQKLVACEEHPSCFGKCLVSSHKPTPRHVLWEKAADEIPVADRQRFIDLMYKEGKNLGQAKEIMGFEFEVAMVIVDRQIQGHTYHTFNEKVSE